MTRTGLAAAALLSLVPAGAGAGELPTPRAPARHAVARLQDGRLALQIFIPVPQQHEVLVNRTVRENGRVFPVTTRVRVVRKVMVAAMRLVDPTRVQATEVGGGKLTARALAARLEKETHVLLVEDRKPGAEFLGLLKKGTLLLTVGPNADLPPGGKDWVPPPGQPPVKSPEPLVAAASVDEDGTVRVRENYDSTRVETGSVPVRDGEKVEDREAAVKTEVIMLRVSSVDIRAVRAFGPDGKQLPAAAVPPLLRRPVTVLLSADGAPVSPFFLEVFREGVPVLALPVPPEIREPVPSRHRP